MVAACSGGSTGPSDGSPDTILQNLRVTNLDGSGFPWNGAAAGRLKRWAEGELIPVQLNGSSLAERALDEIETTLGRTLFDRSSLDGVAPSEVARGLIVSEGTAIGPGGVVDGNSCGHVSEGVGTTAWPQGFYDFSGEIAARLYVHISSSACDASLAVAVHEFGHALGMGAHFGGFGNGPAAGADFWNVLNAIYSNPVGAEAAQLQLDAIR